MISFPTPLLGPQPDGYSSLKTEWRVRRLPTDWQNLALNRLLQICGPWLFYRSYCCLVFATIYAPVNRHQNSSTAGILICKCPTWLMATLTLLLYYLVTTISLIHLPYLELIQVYCKAGSNVQDYLNRKKWPQVLIICKVLAMILDHFADWISTNYLSVDFSYFHLGPYFQRLTFSLRSKLLPLILPFHLLCTSQLDFCELCPTFLGNPIFADLRLFSNSLPYLPQIFVKWFISDLNCCHYS